MIFLNNDKSEIFAEITGISDDNKLLEIFKNNDDFEIRYTIVNLINDDSILYEIFTNEQDQLIKSAALNRISTDILDYDDFNALDEYEKITYIENHDNESLLHNIAEKDSNFLTRIAAIHKIHNRDLLLDLASNHEDYDTRVVLYKILNDKSILDEITGDNLAESRIRLVEDLDNETFLEDIAVNDSDFDVQLSALKKLNRPDFFFTFFKDVWSHDELRQYIKTIAYQAIRKDILNYDDFKVMNMFEKIFYIETHDNESLFQDIAEKDENPHVRVAAIHKIQDRDFLLKMANGHNDYGERVIYYKKLNNSSLLEEITRDNLAESRINLVRNLGNKKFLKDIALNDSILEVQRSALKKLNLPDFYFNLFKNTLSDQSVTEFIRAIVLNDESADIRNYNDFEKMDKYERIVYIETHSDESLFHDIAEKDDFLYVRIAAICKIQDRDFLLDLANRHEDYNTRVVLYKKLNGKSILEEITDENLAESRMDLVRDLNNEKFLEDITINDPDLKVKKAALKKVNKSDRVFELLLDAKSPNDVGQIMEDIKDESKLIDIIKFFSSDSNIVGSAVGNITNLSTLFALYQRYPGVIREAAIKKLVFGNVFSDANIADKISVRPMISSVWDKDDLADVAINESNRWLRREAVRAISDQNILVDVARNDSEGEVREEAVRKIEDVDVLVDIARNDSNYSVRRDALLKIEDKDVLADIARNNSFSGIREVAIGKIDDSEVLVDIARNDSEADVRREAVLKIDDVDVLVDIARNDSEADVRREAVLKIDDEDVLVDIARNDSKYSVRRDAVLKIDDMDVLVDIARNDSDGDVRREAVLKIDDANILVDILRNCSSDSIAYEIPHNGDAEDILIDIAKNHPDSNVRRMAVLKIDDNNILADIVNNDSEGNVRSEAFRRISDGDVLVDIFSNAGDYGFRYDAIECISDEGALEDIARNDPDDSFRRCAAEQIHDEDVLMDIFRNDTQYYVRENALERINDADKLQMLLLENLGYLSINSYSSFKRNYDNMIYESMGCSIYEDILDKISDESVFTNFVHENLFGDFRVLVVRRLTSEDVLRNLALNDLDYRVRREAVKNPNLCDSKTFAEIVKSDYNDCVRLEALRQIDDDDLLEEMTNDLSPLIRLHAFQRLKKSFELKEEVSFEDIDLSSIGTIEDENVLYSIAKNAPSPAIRRYAFNKIEDERILANLISCGDEFMNSALKKITNRNLLLNIALYSTNISTKRKAVKKIDDEEFLLKVVQNNPYNEISDYIVDRIRDESLLEIIALNNSNPFNRKAAVNKIQSQDILKCLGETECEEVVCNAIVRKTRDKRVLEYIGLSNPCKTVRRYVESVTDDDELLYKFALKEYESDNRREIISKLTNEEYIVDLLKRESSEDVFKADFEITNIDLLIDLAKNSLLPSAKRYALNNFEDKKILMDFVYGSPFISGNPRDNSVWEGIEYDYYDKWLCLSILLDLNEMKLIEDFLVENEVGMSQILFDVFNKLTKSSIYRILLNSKSECYYHFLKPKLKYADGPEDVGSRNHRHEDDDEVSEEEAIQGLGALFG